MREQQLNVQLSDDESERREVLRPFHSRPRGCGRLHGGVAAAAAFATLAVSVSEINDPSGSPQRTTLRTNPQTTSP
jgi:hypothetical protein